MSVLLESLSFLLDKLPNSSLTGLDTNTALCTQLPYILQLSTF